MEDLMAEQLVYECDKCGKTIETTKADDKAPECCGQQMREHDKLPACGLSTTAEHSRFDDMGEPCDDGRSGKV